MNCPYITLFFNFVAGIFQTFIKSWNQLLYPRVIEVCCLHFEPPHDFFLHLIILVELFPSEKFLYVKNQVEIHNVTINSNSLFVNFRWNFTFCVEKSYDGTHLAFRGTLDRCCHFKRVSLKQTRFYHSQMSTAHRWRIKVDDSVALISIKNFPIGLHVMYLYFPDTPRNFIFFGSLVSHLKSKFNLKIIFKDSGRTAQ